MDFLKYDRILIVLERQYLRWIYDQKKTTRLAEKYDK